VATGRNPKGTYVRNTPDWFIDKLQSGYVDIGAIGGSFSIGSLFNNSSQGETLFVYGLYSWILDPANYGILQFSLGQQGSEPAQGTNPIQAAAPIDAGIVTFTYTNDASASQIGCIGGGNIPGDRHTSHPQAIVPPGYALSIRSSGGSVRHVVGFWWVALKS